MAITLDNINRIETDYFEFVDALSKYENGVRFCVDVEKINTIPKPIIELKLVPLEDFKCKRMLVGNHGTKVIIESKCGLIEDDFIDIGVTGVEVVESNYNNYSTIGGVLIPHTNKYFSILNQLAHYFKMVKSDNNNSFILDAADIDEIKLVPFTLKYDGSFIVENFEDEMSLKEYNALIDELYCSDYAL